MPFHFVIPGIGNAKAAGTGALGASLLSTVLEGITTSLNREIRSQHLRPGYSRKDSSSDEEDIRRTARSHELSEESSDEEDTAIEYESDDAFSYDDYAVDSNPPLSKDEKRQVLLDKKKQAPEGYLPSFTRNRDISFATKKELDESKKKFEGQDPNKRSNENGENLWRRPVWLHVPMPATFNYTGAVLTNTIQKGLLHMVIRHGHEIERHIPHFKATFNKLPSHIQKMISRIQKSRYDSTTRSLAGQLERALLKLDSETSENVAEILYDLQMMLYEYLLKNVELDGDNNGYLGEGANSNRNQTVFFKVNNLEGNTEVMVICPVDDLYHTPNCFPDDRRPVRSIVTCYFKTWKDYMRSYVEVLFDLTSLLLDSIFD